MHSHACLRVPYLVICHLPGRVYKRPSLSINADCQTNLRACYTIITKLMQPNPTQHDVTLPYPTSLMQPKYTERYLYPNLTQKSSALVRLGLVALIEANVSQITQSKNVGKVKYARRGVTQDKIADFTSVRAFSDIGQHTRHNDERERILSSWPLKGAIKTKYVLLIKWAALAR